MITIGVIFLILLLVFGFICLWNDEPMASAWSFIFAVIIGTGLIFLIKEDDETPDDDNTISAIVYDVVDYQIDTNVVINETDTLKTYTITYFTE